MSYGRFNLQSGSFVVSGAANDQARSLGLREYGIITASYWAFTLTDGALRLLVILFFHQLGYDAFTIASLFLWYEFFGIVTNGVGGWLAARIGLNRTMQIGMVLQVAALLMLTVDTSMLTVTYVMAAQALSGVAKDLNKMSAKSSIKWLLKQNQQAQLFKWVALLTGSKNALKGVGFFLGGALLSSIGFVCSLYVLASVLAVLWLFNIVALRCDIGRMSTKPKWRAILSPSASINRLSIARLCLFAARDVWFVVALPVYCQEVLQWSHWQVGSYLAVWVMGYGVVQALAPRWLSRNQSAGEPLDYCGALWSWCRTLTVIPWLLGALLMSAPTVYSAWIIGLGLLVFGIVFAINSALHSFVIVDWAKHDSVALDVGFYYMSNAAGRLLGTLLSGAVYWWFGLPACLLVAGVLLLLATVASRYLQAPRR